MRARAITFASKVFRDRSRKPAGGGTGLGLWMVQRFVSAGDGKLDIKTSPGLGTTIRLIFPRAENE